MAHLTVLEQGEHLARRNDILVARGERATATMGRDRGATVAPLKTTQAIADEAGMSKRSLKNRLHIAAGIAEDVRDKLRDTDIADSTTQLIALARMEPEQQREVAAQVAAGAVSVKDAKQQLRRRELQEKSSLAIDIPNNVILHVGDMLETMPSLGKFDLLLTDPPYGVTSWEWDKLNTEAWLDAIIPHMADEYNLFWFCSPRFAADTEFIFRDRGLTIQSRIVWHRRNMALGSAAKNKFIDTWEMILHTGNRPLNFPPEWSDAWFDVQVFPVPQTNFNDSKVHPMQKPLALIARLIEFGSYPGDAIIDPFAGSGTTAAACPKDRHCTLIELQNEYADVIENRLGVLRK